MSYKLTEEQAQYLAASKTVELTKQELTQKVNELQLLVNQNTVDIKMLHDLLFEGLDEDPFAEPSH